jgi:hypothetical protein
MKEFSLIKAYDDFEQKIKTLGTQKNYRLKLILILTILVNLISSPVKILEGESYFKNHQGWKAVMAKKENLLDPLKEFHPDSHSSKKVFRLTVPLVMKIFNLNEWQTYLIQFLLGILLLLTIYNLVFSISSSVPAATYTTAGLAFTYYGKACFVDTGSWFDGWAYLFIALSLSNRNGLLIFLFATLAAWVDERAFFSLPVIALFHRIRHDSYSLHSFKRLINTDYPVLAAMGFYVAIRLFITYYYGIETPKSGVGLGTLKKNWGILNFSFWTFFEGYILILLLGIYSAFRNKNYLFWGLCIALLSFLTFVAFNVLDTTRSGSYMVPFIFLFILYAYKKETASLIHKLLFISMVISFVFPAYYVVVDIHSYHSILNELYLYLSLRF